MGVKKLYYVKTRRGQGIIYSDKPKRVEELGHWDGKIEGCYCSVVSDMEARGLIKLPDISWEDKPFELKLTLTYG